MKSILCGALGGLIIGQASLAGLWLERTDHSDRRQEAPQINVEDVLSAYIGGDDLAVERWLTRDKVLPDITKVVQSVSRGVRWNPSVAAFLLEMAVRTSDVDQVSTLLAAGGSMVTGRPASLGVNPVEDRFEVLWHHTALGVAQGLPPVSLQQQYLDVVWPRFESARNQGILVDTRLPLARGIAAEIICCWKLVSGRTVRLVPRRSRSSVTIEIALSLFAEAAKVPSLQGEALVRGSKLLQEAGRDVEAEAWLRRVPAHDDDALAYVQNLTHGRVLDTLGRPGDAAAFYQRALNSPGAGQVAGIGLAAALLRTGQVAAAVEVADRTRNMPDDERRLFIEFERADARFVSLWLAEIRRLRR
jgi:hypothetical protein